MQNNEAARAGAATDIASPHWHVVCRAQDLREAPIARRIMGVPIVLFRTRGGVAALLDRCPHRNVPLSLGRVDQQQLQCAYHGWRFDADGVCQHVPALTEQVALRSRNVPCFTACEQQGFVWVRGRGDADARPYVYPYLDDRRYTHVQYTYSFAAGVAATAENILDVPHTAYLHRGLFRGRGTHRVRVVVRRNEAGVEAEYVGEPRPSGLIGWLLAPGGGEVRHWDRFVRPSVAQVEYRLGERSHVVATTFLTPVSEARTDAFTWLSLRLPVPGWVLRPAVMPVAKRILRQDADILAAQTQVLRDLGEEAFVSTAADVLGLQIRKILQQTDGLREGAAETVREVELEL